MSETFMIGMTSFGVDPDDEELRLEARLFTKPNSEVCICINNNLCVPHFFAVHQDDSTMALFSAAAG